MAINRDEQTDTHVFPEQSVPLQVARWTEQRESVTTSGASQRITLPVGSSLIELTAIEAVFINFGDVTVDASSVIADDGSRLFLAGVQVVPVPLDSSGDPYTHLAVIQQSVAGIFQVEQLS